MSEIINAVGDCTPKGITPEIMDVDLFSSLTPSAPFVGKVTDEFLVLGINTDDWIASFEIMVSNPMDVVKLAVSVWMVWSAQAFAVGDQSIIELLQQSSDRCTANVVCLLTQKDDQLA